MGVHLGGGVSFPRHISSSEPTRSKLTSIFMAVAGVAAAVAAVIGVGYVAPTAVDMFTHLPSEVEVGVGVGAAIGFIGGALKAMDGWGHALSEDLGTMFFGAVAGGIVGGLFGEGWHLATSTSQQVGALIPEVQDAISSAVATAAKAALKPA